MKIFKVLRYEKGWNYSMAGEHEVNKFHVDELSLVKLGLIDDPRKGKSKWDAYTIEYNMRHTNYTLYVQQVTEAHHYNRYKMHYLRTNAIEWTYGYILPSNKVDVFLSSDLKPERKEITISVYQDRIPKIGQEKVAYIVYHELYETEYERRTRNGVIVCRKSDYMKNHEHYGKYILVNVIRPEIMCGTIEEIERDIKNIILDKIKKEKLIDFLRNNN